MGSQSARGQARGPAWGRRGRGQAVVETALLLPVLLVIVLVAVDFGRLYAAQITVNDAARQAARYAAADPADQSVASPCGQWGGTVLAAQQEAAGSPVTVNCPDVGVQSGGPDTYGGSFVTATVRSPFSLMTPLLGSLVAIDHVSGSNTARVSGTGTSCPSPYAGRAWAAATRGVAVAGIPVADTVVGDSGSLPATGGTVAYAGSATVTVPGVLTAQTTIETASGANCFASATSKVASATILAGRAPGGLDIADATVLFATTSQGCGGAAAQSGFAASVTIAGTTITIPSGPNQVVTIPNEATVTLDRQAPGSSPPSVDAVVISFPPGGLLSGVVTGTITLSHAEAGC